MRSSFREFYVPTSAEVEVAWASGWIVLDTNVLLNMYSYPKPSRELWQKVMSLLRERGQIWMPHQVGLEYQRNRPAIMMSQKEVYAKLLAGVAEIGKQADSMDNLVPHPVVDIQKYSTEIREVLEKQKRRLEDAQRKHKVSMNDDPIRDAIDAAYEGFVGEALDPKELEELYKQGAARYAALIPPGFGDADKAEERARAGCDFGVQREYGDLVIWEQVKRQATATKRPIIIVTDDKKKGDWFWLSKTKARYGVHPILRREMYEASGQCLLVNTPNDFLELASERLNILGVEKAIAEVQLVDEQVLRRRDMERQRVLRAASLDQAYRTARLRSGELEQELEAERGRGAFLEMEFARAMEEDDRPRGMDLRRAMVESRERQDSLMDSVREARAEMSAIRNTRVHLLHGDESESSGEPPRWKKK